MIKVNRHIDQIPKSLSTRGVKELEKIMEELRTGGKIISDHTAYRQTDVKKALKAIFKKKCAYCESKFGYVSPGAVEHFRPKGRDMRKYKEPAEDYIGYYWLAARWDNLLLSCTDCNSERSHPVPGKEEEVLMGKQDKFPLLSEEYRCKRSDDDIAKEKEQVVLVDPCVDEPSDYFEFTDDGLIKAKEGLKGNELTRSERSMEIYALYRGELVDARKEYFTNMIGKELLEIEEMKKALNTLSASQMTAINALNKLINKKIRYLIELGNPEKEFSAMAKQLVAQELKKRLNVDVNKF